MSFSLKFWLKDLWQWLKDAWVPIAAVIVPILIFFGASNFNFSEFSVRLSGYVLQMLGMILAIKGIISVRAYFGYRPLRYIAWDFMYRLLDLGKRRTVAAKVDAVLDGVKVDMRVTTRHPDDPELTIDERLKAVHRNLDLLRSEIGSQADILKRLRDDHEGFETSQNQRTDKLRRSIKEDIETLHTDDLPLSLVGLIWLIIGITASTFSSEIYLIANGSF